MTARPSIPADVEAFRHLQSGRLKEALTFAEQAVAGQRTCVPAHGMLATILLQLGRAADAENVICGALDYRLGSADAYDALAHVSMLLGKHERSNELYRRVVELAPNEARFWYNLASSERSFGRLTEAEAACDRAIALDATHYASYLLRSELRVQSDDSNHITELQSLLTGSKVDDRARVLLGYALAKELDDLQRFDEAFGWFSEAARTRRRHLQYDVAVDERKLRRIIDSFPEETVSQASLPQNSSRYIFIAGLPRSGTTLMEHILLGLPGVRSNGETDNFSRALLSALPPVSGDVFARAVAADPDVVATNYQRFADRGSVDVAIIEKLPMNYLYLGAIRRALPQARVLILRRDPLDSCFAMYRTLFGSAYPFSYDFEDLARYYAAFDQLIRHWRRTLGEMLYEVDYEELVGDPLHFGARVAQHCRLRWDERAIAIEKSASISLTASAAQIRRPIYGSSSGRWRHYHAHLGPLISALRRQHITLPNDA